MTPLNYALSLLIIFLGGVAGAYIAKSAKEEMPTAIRYFPVIQAAILLAALAVLINGLPAGIATKAAVYAPIALSLVRAPRKIGLVFLAVSLYFSADKNAFFIISALSFLFALTEGSFMIAEKTVRKK